MPYGFANGKINGKIYFIRLKHDNGAWNEHPEGTDHLLQYINLNAFFQCERSTRAMTCQTIEESCLKGRDPQPPTFLYIYCDSSFTLTNSEVRVLSDYLGMGGFLFMDSRDDDLIQARVAQEMSRVMEGKTLSPISGGDTINHFMFDIAGGAYGFSDLYGGTRRNYGIRGDSGKLQVFYSRGNWAALFGTVYRPDDPVLKQFADREYQMATNVILYAIDKGDDSTIEKKSGAQAVHVSESMLSKLGFLDSTPGGSTAPKIHRKPGSGTSGSNPTDVDVLGD